MRAARRMAGSIVVAVWLAACSGGGSGGTSAPTTEPPRATTEPPETTTTSEATTTTTSPPVTAEGSDRWSLATARQMSWAGDGRVIVEANPQALVNQFTEEPMHIDTPDASTDARELRLIDIRTGDVLATHGRSADDGIGGSEAGHLGIGAPLAVEVTTGTRPASGLSPEVEFVRLALVDLADEAERWAQEFDLDTNPSYGDVLSTFGVVHGVTDPAVVVSSETDRNVITALSTTDGSVLWQREGELPTRAISPDGSRLLVFELGEFTNLEGFSVVDIASGEDVVHLEPPGEAWLFGDHARWLSPTTWVATANDSSTLIGGVDSGVAPVILRDGDVPWTGGTDFRPIVVVDDAAAYMVSDAGGLTAVELATGATRWSIPIPAGSDRTPRPVAVAGDRLVVNIWGGDPEQVGVYDTETGDELALLDGQVDSVGTQFEDSYLWHGSYRPDTGTGFGVVRVLANEANTILGMDADGKPLLLED